MDGLPVVIRLIDPPLHEFLPNHEELLRRGDHRPGARRGECRPDSHAKMLARAVERLREQNPMLGLRGCRLGLMIPGLHQDADARHPQAAVAAQAGAARTRCPRS